MPHQTRSIPKFFLYGEPPRPARGRFVHVEHLDKRSRPANWLIRAHAHGDLHHLFVLASGNGRIEADGRALAFNAPCLVAMPAGVVHGFHFQAETQGQVLTFSEALLRDLAQQEVALINLFNRGMWHAALPDAHLAEVLVRLARELGWMAPGHELAVTALVASVLVEALRLHQVADQALHTPPGPHVELVARFRGLIEAAYRRPLSINMAAKKLGVTPARLRSACHTVANVAPQALIQERVMLEARRVMHYSNMSIAQVAVYLGFADAAYFSRFFTRHAGMSPRAYRQARSAQDRVSG